MRFYQTVSDRKLERRSSEEILLDLDLHGRKLHAAFREQWQKRIDSGIIGGKSWTESTHSARKLRRVRRDASQAWLVSEYPM